MTPRRRYLYWLSRRADEGTATKLDVASAQDGIHYMLTIASPSSGYLVTRHGDL